MYHHLFGVKAKAQLIIAPKIKNVTKNPISKVLLPSQFRLHNHWWDKIHTVMQTLLQSGHHPRTIGRFDLQYH
jgi:hypothetical protein